jgi:hypothetical protein
MFDPERVAADVDDARKMERLYHRGQERAWNGKQVLDDLCTEHGDHALDAQERAALREVLGSILWGELAAWKIAAKLSADVVPLDVKLATTSQAHDESRHFYVLHDYLERRLDGAPKALHPDAQRMFERVLAAEGMARRVLGMHLVVEPMAQSIFHLLRERHLDPVLTDLMPLYERDEARHVALGVLFLPRLLADMGPREIAELATWQLRTYLLQVDLLRAMTPQLEALGLDPRVVYRQGRKRQLAAMRLVGDELGRSLPITELFLRVIDFKCELELPRDRAAALPTRLRRATEAALFGEPVPQAA